MLQNDVLTVVLEDIPSPMCVVSPVRDSITRIVDVQVEFVNKAFVSLTRGSIRAGEKLTAIYNLIDRDINLLSLLEKCMELKLENECEFYSSVLGLFLKMNIKSSGDGLAAIYLEDITKLKNAQMMIQKQNLRLEALTEELTANRTDLEKKLSSIEMLNSQLREAAYHDALTNLSNRFMYKTKVREAASKAAKNNTKFAVLLFDVDNIKVINDSKGANAGDNIIQTIAQTLRKFEDENTSAFRYNGDEFILLKNNLTDREEIAAVAEEIQKILNSKDISISGGITVYPDDTNVAEDMHPFADMAKTEAKRAGKNAIFVFQQIMQDKFLSKVNIESKMAKAMADNVFQLYFQPQFDASTNELRGFEALLRWYDEELGWISPEQFIPLAEESNLVVPIGDWVMEKGLSTLEEWESKYNFTGILSINVSPIQFEKEDFMIKFKSKLAQHKINPEHLEVEVTEGILIDDVDSAISKLNEIKDMGIGISLDDFGTGYSSLRYLQMLPLTTLKIDKSFISNINNQGGTEANITESIVSMVSKMGLDTIAEGVETKEQLQILQHINCRNIQGFLKGKPMPKSICDKILAGDYSAIVSLENQKAN